MARRLPNEAHAIYVLSLTDIARRDVECVGVKAAHLSELAGAGFPVPNGFVLTTRAFERFLAANALGLVSSPEAVTAAFLPTDVADALLAAAASLGDVSLAVRSSGIAEDLPNASFAGQYETVLDVRGVEALLAAVRRVFASAFSRHVAAYRATQAPQATAHMAVLVQRLVAAETAGVALLGAVIWYLVGHNRFKRSVVPIVLSGMAIIVQVVGLVVEKDDPASFGDNIGGMWLFVPLFVVLIAQFFLNRRHLAASAGVMPASGPAAVSAESQH